MRRKPVIIAVDDNLHELDACAALLGGRFEVLKAGAAGDMFRMLKTVTPDLILLDVAMPGMGGYEAARALKKDGRHSGVPIIFVSGMSDETSESEGFAAGAADYIHKPYGKEQIIRRIETQLSLLRLQREYGELRAKLVALTGIGGMENES